MIKPLLLFDFDGVIVDSLKISHDSSNEILPKPIDLAAYRLFFHGNIFEHEDVVKQDSQQKQKMTDDHPFYQRYIPRLRALSPIEQVHALIPELAKVSSLFVITSTTTGPVQEFLDKHRILSSFKQILGSDVHTNKSHKIKMVLESEQAVPEDCIFITDTLGDIREAEKAGVQSIAVTWGFHERVDLEKGSPYAIVSTAQQLKEKIDEFFA